jgi:hypothetical protein
MLDDPQAGVQPHPREAPRPTLPDFLPERATVILKEPEMDLRYLKWSEVTPLARHPVLTLSALPEPDV